MSDKSLSARPERPAPGFRAASGLYLLAAAGLWVTSLLTAALAGPLSALTREWQGLVISAAYYGLFLVLPIALWASRAQGAADALRLNPVAPGDALRAVGIALICVLIVYDVNVFWMAFLQKLGLNVMVDGYVRPAGAGELTRSVLSASLVAVVGEELLFRGVLFSAWERRGARKAVVVTALLFAMLHGSLLGLPAEILGGAVIALVVLWTDSLYAGMIFHSAYNAALVMISYLASGAPADEAADALMQTDMVAALGGWGTLLALAVETAFMLLMLALLLKGLRARAARRGLREAPETPVPMRGGETWMLLASALCAAGLYAVNLMTMLGG